jgi:hypothetical protein
MASKYTLARLHGEQPIAHPKAAPKIKTVEDTKVKSTVVLITPELATKWLEGNTHNRPIRDSVVERYARMMRNGQWELNGEAIIFDRDGKLANGQHRLWACVESETNFETVVVIDVDPDAFLTVDQGAKRTAGDALHIDKDVDLKGVNRNWTAAAATLIWQYRTDNLFGKSQLMPSMVLDLIKSEPAIIEWVREANRAPKGLRSFATPLAAVLHIGSKGFPDKANEFVARFVDGANLSPGNPILALRARAVSNAPHVQWERMYLVVSAWNAFAMERNLFKIMSVPRSDEFPRIKGA